MSGSKCRASLQPIACVRWAFRNVRQGQVSRAGSTANGPEIRLGNEHLNTNKNRKTDHFSFKVYTIDELAYEKQVVWFRMAY